MNIGVIGNGFVGSALIGGFSLSVDKIYVFDKNIKLSNSTLIEVVKNTDIIFICLPTPMAKLGFCDLSIMEGVFSEICKLDVNISNKIFVIKSTIPPGTTTKLSNKFVKMNFVFNPEFLTERTARLDFINTSRIVLGGAMKDVEKIETLYRLKFPYTKIIKTDFETAEMIKYMANCFFSTKISFMNEMKQIAQAANVDWETAKEGFITDGRIGNSHINVPGHDGSHGFGGKCFPKDINALIYKAEELGINPLILKASWEKNLEVREIHDWLDIPGAVSKDEA
jgi:nucleotide sugar dehydrogenase